MRGRTVLKLAAIIVAVCGLIPGGRFYTQRVIQLNQWDYAHLQLQEIKCAMIAVAGFVLAYVLYPFGARENQILQ